MNSVASACALSYDYSVTDTVDIQLEHLEKVLKEKNFKPVEGLTQGYVDCQRVFSRVGIVILSFLLTIDGEFNKDVISTDDNLMRTRKILESYVQNFSASKCVKDMYVDTLLEEGKIKNAHYSLSFETPSKSVMWCIASFVRVLFVGSFYNVDIPLVTSTKQFVSVAKQVFNTDFDYCKFNYGTYLRTNNFFNNQQCMFNRPINSQAHAQQTLLTFSPLFAQQKCAQSTLDGYNSVTSVKRCQAMQSVVDTMQTTQDTYSTFLPAGKYKQSIASAYDNISTTDTLQNSYRAVIERLRSDVVKTVPATTPNHSSQFESSKIFYNVPRNIRGPSIFNKAVFANGQRLSEIVVTKLPQSYTEDVAASVAGYSFLRNRELFVAAGAGHSLQQSIVDGVLTPINIHTDELLFISIVKDEGCAAPNTQRQASSRMLESVLTSELDKCFLMISKGLPLASLEHVTFFVSLVPPQDNNIAFYLKTTIFALATFADCSGVNPDNLIITPTDFKLPLSIFKTHITEHCAAAIVNAHEKARQTIGCQMTAGGQRLEKEAYKSIAVNFLRSLANMQQIIT